MHIKRPSDFSNSAPRLSVYENGYRAPRPKPPRRILLRPAVFWALIIGFILMSTLAAYFILDSHICRALAF